MGRWRGQYTRQKHLNTSSTVFAYRCRKKKADSDCPEFDVLREVASAQWSALERGETEGWSGGDVGGRAELSTCMNVKGK
ncbi:hypothetical protein PISMIDRAFT_315501 [Pisolithus microcarpus 441]|uniref:Uncharacterized protein n=1 Tax=Pisolithus microcarpus 441 TaxID=765257 RepID=A0A0C9ZUV0_9AGAM|nr:hypothetical protein PISMIDRAFT_315501 [Pisolithus microcarpus 441]